MLTSRSLTILSIAAAMFIAAAISPQKSRAQDSPAAAAAFDITGIPEGRGVYYHSSTGWVALSPRVLMPLWDERPVGMEVLNMGSDHTVTQLPGRHAGIQISSDARPMLYLHGISPADLYLLRMASRGTYREVRMRASRHFWDWVDFHDKDLADLQIEAVNGDIVAVRPVAALHPGEYTLASLMGANYQWLRLGFDFGILGAAPGR